jgi:hypothetical protein
LNFIFFREDPHAPFVSQRCNQSPPFNMIKVLQSTVDRDFSLPTIVENSNHCK